MLNINIAILLGQGSLLSRRLATPVIGDERANLNGFQYLGVDLNRAARDSVVTLLAQEFLC
jgi:hypothetical protein